VALSLIFYGALFISAPTIADYFNMPPLTNLARVLFLAIIINSLFIIPNIILTRQLRFKEIAIAELSGMIVSAGITITMAMNGFGYWAIAAQQISQLVVKVGIIWILSRWRPSLEFDFKLLKEIFSFSFLLIISSLISTATRYIYNFFIGPRYSADDLGYYGQAFKFHQIPYNVITSTITGVSYPVFSSLSNDKERQMLYIQKIMRMTAFITFPVMIGLYGIAPNFISVILTDKWMPMLPYFKILILAGMAMPFINLNLNIFNVIGKPRLYFQMEFLRNGLIIALLFVLNSTIEIMLYGYLIATYTTLIVSCIMIKKHINYSLFEQISHILPSLILAIVMGTTITTIEHKLVMGDAMQLILQLGLGGLAYIALAWGSHLEIMDDIVNMLKEKFHK
jgi:O-antigen/teichoic acid export membrane protein